MSGGGSQGHKVWSSALVLGLILVGAAFALGHEGAGLPWLHPALEGIGGVLVIFAACELLIKAVDGIGKRMGMNPFVAGTMAGISSAIPELVMLAFVLLATPRVGFLVTAFTVHVNVAAFGIYSALLPRHKEGGAALPEPLVALSTDLFACAGAAFFTTGTIMLLMHAFAAGPDQLAGLGATDMYVLGGALLLVEVVGVTRLVTRFSGTDEAPQSIKEEQADKAPREIAAEAPGFLLIGGFALAGIVASVIGGHAVGGFAGTLVAGLEQAGYPKMVGALILSLFAGTGGFVMMISAHSKRMHDVALAGASGQVTQVAFLILPVTMILLAAFSQLGMIAPAAGGYVLPVDLDTVSVLLLGFPSMLVLWKAVRDDGRVRWLESTTMMAVFGLVIYFLAMHG